MSNQELHTLQRMYDKWERDVLERGRLVGKSNAILTVLEARHIPVSPEAAARIQGTADLRTLTTWLIRAVSAATVDEVFEPPVAVA